MKKLEVYCNNLISYVSKAVIECKNNNQEVPGEIELKGKIAGLANVYLDIESDLIDFYESNFTNKKSIEIIKLKVNDIVKYLNSLEEN